MLSDMFALGLEMDWAIPQTLVWYCWEVRHRFDPQWKWQTAWPTQSQQRIIPNKHPRAPPPTVWPWKIQRTPVWRARACQWWSHHQLQNLNALWYDEAYVVWPMSKAVPKLHQPKLCEICYGENLSLAKKSSYGYLWYQITQFCQVWKSQTLKKHIPLITPSFTKVFLQGHSRSWSVSQTSFPEGKKNTHKNNCLLESRTIKQGWKTMIFPDMNLHTMLTYVYHIILWSPFQSCYSSTWSVCLPWPRSNDCMPNLSMGSLNRLVNVAWFPSKPNKSVWWDGTIRMEPIGRIRATRKSWYINTIFFWNYYEFG